MIYIIIPLTLLLGTVLSFEGERFVLLYAAYYGACFLILKSYKYGDDFFRTFDYQMDRPPEKKYILAGQEVRSDESKDKQEDRFLNVFALSRVVKRRIVSTLIVVAGMWFFFLKAGVEISPRTLFPFIICSSIVNSFYVGHLLFALGMNLFMVLFTYNSNQFIGLYFVYAFLLFFSVSLIGAAKPLKTKYSAASLLAVTLLTLGMIYGFSWILPQKVDFADEKFELKGKQAKVIRDYLKDTRVQLGKMQGASSSIDISETLQMARELEMMARKTHLSPAEQEQLKAGLESLMLDMESLPTGRGSMSSDVAQEEQKRIQKMAQDLARDLEKESLNGEARQLTDLEKNQLLSLAGQIKNDPSGKLKGEQEQLENLSTRPQLSKDEQKVLSETLARIDQKATPTPQMPVPQHKTLTEVEKKEILMPLKKDEDSQRWKKLKRMLPFIIGCIIFALVYFFLKKKGVKRIETIDEDLLTDLREDWKNLKQKKLSPNEEVIHYYNLFHNSLQKIHYSEHEAPPSCIIYRDMTELNPELDKATLAITEIFAQCYYGKKNVTSDALKLFRKAIAKILKVYQLV